MRNENGLNFFAFIFLLLMRKIDAVRTKEWKMFIILKDMADEKAYKVSELSIKI